MGDETGQGGTGSGSGDAVLRVGVTGHVNLTPATIALVAAQLENRLRMLHGALGRGGAVVGVSCLAPGADSVFARVVLDLGGALEVLVPSPDYRGSKLGPEDGACFDALVGHARLVWTGTCATAGPRAYAAANDELLRRIGHLFAVWDGGATGGLGSTADTVHAARSRRIPVTIVWPEGAERC